MTILNSSALHIVLQIASYYNSESERIPRVPWANIYALARPWYLSFFAQPSLVIVNDSIVRAICCHSLHFDNAKCILSPIPEESYSCQPRSGKAGGNSPGFLSDPTVTAHLVLKQREESTVKNQKRSTQYERSIPAVKWLILLVAMVTINSVSRTFV